MSSNRWDSDHDGKVSTKDLIMQFDNSGNGILDGNELALFAEQLSNQLEYNNTLLEQVQRLESEQLVSQREIQQRQDMIRKISQENEKMKNELADCKKKLTMAQDLTDTLTRQSRESRMECNTYKQEAENVIREVTSLKQMVDKLNNDKAILQKELVDTQQESRITIDKLEDKISELESEVSTFKSINEGMNREIAENRDKIHNLETERLGLTNNVRNLTNSIEDLTKRVSIESMQREREEKLAREAKSAADHMRNEYMEMELLLQDAVERAGSYQRANEEHKQRLTAMDEAIAEHRAHYADLEMAALRVTEENNKYKQEIDAFQRELNLERSQAQMAQEKYNKILQTTRDEYETALNDTRRQSISSISESQRRAAFAEEAQAKAEESYFNIHHELKEVHEVMQQLTTEHAAAQREWVDRKRELERQISDLQGRVKSLETEKRSQEQRLLQEMENGESKLRALKAEHARKVDGYIEILASLASEAKSLKEQVFQQRTVLRECGLQVDGVKQRCSQAMDRSKQEQRSYREDVQRALQKLLDMRQGLLNEVEVVRDQLQESAVALEEQRGKMLDLEDNSSELKLTIAKLENEKLQNVCAIEDKTRKCQAVIEKSANEKSLYESKLQKLQQALDAMSQQNKNMQNNQLATQGSLVDMSNKYSAEKQALESKISALLSQVKTATDENSQLLRRIDDLQSTLGQTQAAQEKLRADTQSAVVEAQKSRKEADELKSKHLQALSNVGGTNQQFQNQLKQSQEIIKVMQAQKSELMQQNQQLRGDLDKYYDILQSHGLSVN